MQFTAPTPRANDHQTRSRAVPDKLNPFIISVIAGAIGGFAALVRALYEGISTRRAVLLSLMAFVLCGLLCVVALHLLPDWSPFVIGGITGLVGFTAGVAVRQLDAIVSAIGAITKKKIE
jgi:hypothetical protein